jgi:hypothetical protein
MIRSGLRGIPVCVKLITLNQYHSHYSEWKKVGQQSYDLDVHLQP